MRIRGNRHRERFFIQRGRAHSRAERKEIIYRSHQLPLTRQSSILNLSRPGMYYQATPVSGRDLGMMRLIDELHMKYPFWGSRSIRNELRGLG